MTLRTSKMYHDGGYTNIFIYIAVSSIICLLAGEVLAGPKVELDRHSIDLGSISGNTTVEKRTIVVTNTGTNVLTLEVSGSTCGCISSSKYDKTIPPGKKGAIELHIDPQKLGDGSKLQRIVFATNDPDRPYVPIDITWRSKRREAVTISPREISVELSKVEMKSYARRSNNIMVLDTWNKRLEISDICTSPNVSASLYDIVYRCPKGFETHVFRLKTSLAPVDKTGTFDEWIKFSTNHPDFPTVTIPITYHIRSGIRIEPATLIFNDLVEHTSVKNIRIKSLDGKGKLEIEEIQLYDDPWLSVKPFRINPQTIDLQVSKSDAEMDAQNGNGSALQLLKSEIVLTIAEPEKTKQTITIIFLRKQSHSKTQGNTTKLNYAFTPARISTQASTIYER